MQGHPADERWMALALSLGRRGLGRVWPNPAVGCVIVKEGRVLGRGWTGPQGRPHGETQALAQAGDKAQGATAYVTLEPCAHHGKTPPCAAALIKAGVAHVVTAMTDPDLRVAGKGHAMLRAAGIEVVEGCLGAEAAIDHRGFIQRTTRNRPFVTLKLATSVDGRIATASGESQWITGPLARRWVHRMRASHDAVMIGAGTAVADDPSLTVRDLGVAHQPVRVVLDSRLRTPAMGKLAATAAEVPLWMCHGPAAPEVAKADWQDSGARLLECSVDKAGRIAVGGLLTALAEQGLTRVFCEGGGQLAASLLAGCLVDQLITFNAGLALGAGGVPAIAALPAYPLADVKRFNLAETRNVGPDSLQIWRSATR
jgi:diaminohydroxyphosphoribosylaminopyrimidine deaminase / 5-amino-6-(5-phosphoribosylamino)uracil reductase